MSDVYDTLSPRLQEAVDLLMKAGVYSEYGTRNQWIAREMGISVQTIKNYLGEVARRYGIEQRGQFLPSIRIVYLRAKELGLINEAPTS